MRSRSEIVSSYHQLRRKINKFFHDYSYKSIDDFKPIVVNPPSELTDKGKRNIATSFGYYYQYQSIENNTKTILTHVLKCWNKKSQVHTQVHVN